MHKVGTIVFVFSLLLLALKVVSGVQKTYFNHVLRFQVPCLKPWKEHLLFLVSMLKVGGKKQKIVLAML